MNRIATNSNSIQLPPRERTARSCNERHKPRVLRIGLLGMGTVGQGLCRLIADKRSSLIARHQVDFRISKALVRDLKRARAALPSEAALLDDPEAFVSGAYDLVVCVYEKLKGYLVQHPEFLHGVGCVVIDEVQNLGDPTRGNTLEFLAAKFRAAPYDRRVLGSGRHHRDVYGGLHGSGTARRARRRRAPPRYACYPGRS